MTTPNDLPSNADGPRAAIILVNWNAWQDCVECIDSLMGQTYGNWCVFLVDNQSSDGSVAHIQRWCARPRRTQGALRNHPGVSYLTPDSGSESPAIPCRVIQDVDREQAGLPAARSIVIIEAPRNGGYAAGCNLAMRVAGLDNFKFFWLLNTDTVVHKDALGALLRRAQTDPHVGLVGSTVRYYSEPDKIQAMGGGRLDGRSVTTRHIGEGRSVFTLPGDPSEIECELAHIFGASMLASRDFIHDVGPMQEDYFLYFEEFDWALRGKPTYSLGYAPDSHVFHKSGASSSKRMPVFTSRIYYRNRIRFASRFFPQHLGSVKRGLALDLLRQALHGHWQTVGALAAILWNANRLAQEAVG